MLVCLLQSNSVKPSRFRVNPAEQRQPHWILITECTQHTHNGQPHTVHLNRVEKKRKKEKRKGRKSPLFFLLVEPSYIWMHLNYAVLSPVTNLFYLGCTNISDTCYFFYSFPLCFTSVPNALSESEKPSISIMWWVTAVYASTQEKWAFIFSLQSFT